MKRLLLAACIALPMSAFANVLSFQCVSSDLPGVHKFDASGTVSVDDLNKVEGVLTIHTQKAQSIQSVQTFEEVRVTGFIRHFKDGELTKKAFDQLVLTKTNEPYIKSLNLLLDFETKIASRASSIDNFSYRSNCKITDRLE